MWKSAYLTNENTKASRQYLFLCLDDSTLLPGQNLKKKLRPLTSDKNPDQILYVILTNPKHFWLNGFKCSH